MGRGEDFFFGFAVVRRADGVDVCGVRGLGVVEFGEEVVGGFEVVGYFMCVKRCHSQKIIVVLRIERWMERTYRNSCDVSPRHGGVKRDVHASTLVCRRQRWSHHAQTVASRTASSTQAYNKSPSQKVPSAHKGEKKKRKRSIPSQIGICE